MIGVASTIALGLALGVVLQRGGFCGSALLSTFALDRDARGLIGIGFAIAISMAGFAVLAALGLVIVDPNPMRLLSAVVGGVVFGVGMVLAGGCVTGTMFKAAEGRLTSVLALLGIGIGAVATDEGLLAPTKKALVGPTAGLDVPPGLHDLLGLSYPATAGALPWPCWRQWCSCTSASAGARAAPCCPRRASS
ncbi:MAG: YeeE/YedE thiosulfate transporter family protein [Pseudomonadota bacterium]